MTINFDRYTEPGVYIEEEPSPVVPHIGVGPTVVAIVGPSRGHRSTTDSLVLTGEDSVNLTKKGVDGNTIQVQSADGTVYVEDTDYEIETDEGDDVDTDLDDTTMISRVSGSEISDSETVFVSYEYTNANFFEPHRFTDYDRVGDYYGPPFDANGIASYITLAAKLAFNNGVSTVVCQAVPFDGSEVSLEDLTDGYEKLDSEEDVSIVVPLPIGITGSDASPDDSTSVATDLGNALDEAFDVGLRKVGIVGYDTTVSIDPTVVSSAVENQRIMLVHPNRLLYYNGIQNEMIELGSCFLAAAAAGNFASRAPQHPLTKKTVRGFESIAPTVMSKMTRSKKNEWSSQGVSVFEPVRSNLECRHSVTTDTSTIRTREISLVRASDYLMRLIERTVTQAGIIGTPIYSDTPVEVKGVVQSALEVAVESGLIASYVGIKARQLSVDPSVIQVKFQYLPAYPLNYVTVVFSIDVSTGNFEEV